MEQPDRVVAFCPNGSSEHISSFCSCSIVWKAADELHASVHQRGGEEVFTFLHNDLSLSVSLPGPPHIQTEEHLEGNTERSKRTEAGKDAVKSER